MKESNLLDSRFGIYSAANAYSAHLLYLPKWDRIRLSALYSDKAYEDGRINEFVR